MAKHRLYPEDRPVVYLHAFKGWIREVPGSLGKDASGRWYVTESIRTGYRVDA